MELIVGQNLTTIVEGDLFGMCKAGDTGLWSWRLALDNSGEKEVSEKLFDERVECEMDLLGRMRHLVGTDGALVCVFERGCWTRMWLR